MKLAEFDRGRKVHSNTAKTYPQLGLVDTDKAFNGVMRRYGAKLEAQGIIRRVGSGHGTILINAEKYPDALFRLMSRGMDETESAA